MIFGVNGFCIENPCERNRRILVIVLCKYAELCVKCNVRLRLFPEWLDRVHHLPKLHTMYATQNLLLRRDCRMLTRLSCTKCAQNQVILTQMVRLEFTRTHSCACRAKWCPTDGFPCIVLSYILLWRLGIGDFSNVLIGFSVGVFAKCEMNWTGSSREYYHLWCSLISMFHTYTLCICCYDIDICGCARCSGIIPNMFQNSCTHAVSGRFVCVFLLIRNGSLDWFVYVEAKNTNIVVQPIGGQYSVIVPFEKFTQLVQLNDRLFGTGWVWSGECRCSR